MEINRQCVAIYEKLPLFSLIPLFLLSPHYRPLVVVVVVVAWKSCVLRSEFWLGSLLLKFTIQIQRQIDLKRETVKIIVTC